MKNWKSLPLLFITLLTLTYLVTSCGEDREADENEAYIVDVEIITPANNATFAKGETFTVEVDYARDENIIHNIKVEIMDMSGNTVKSLVERHAHVPDEFTFKVDEVTLDEAGTYIIRASTTDLHDGDSSGSHDGVDKDNAIEHTITIE